MSQITDQDGGSQEEYREIIALLRGHRRGRDFLQQFMDGKSLVNSRALMEKITAGGKNAPVMERLTAAQQGQCLDILVSVMNGLDRIYKGQERVAGSLDQIGDTVRTTASQLKSSGEESIAGRVLEDMAGQLEALGEREQQQQKDIAETREQLGLVRACFAEVLQGEDKDAGHSRSPSLSTDKKKTFI